MRGRGLELPEGRRAAWHADERRGRRGSAQLRPCIVEGAGDKGASYLSGMSPPRSALHQRGAVHRSCGAFAAHVLEVMHAILQAGADGETIKIVSRIDGRYPCRTRRRRPTGAAQRP